MRWTNKYILFAYNSKCILLAIRVNSAATVECQGPIGKYGGNAGAGKASICSNHRVNNWIRQESSMGTTSRGKSMKSSGLKSVSP